MAGILAYHIDFYLKKLIKGLPLEVIEDDLQTMLDFSICLHSIEEFLYQSKINLQYRMLLNHTISREAEEILIQNIHRVYGCHESSKFQKMLVDIDYSKELNVEFKRL